MVSGKLQHALKKRRGVGISGEVVTSAPGGALGTVLRAVSEYLLIADEDLVPIVLASVAAHRLDVSPVWLLLVGAPSTGKTEVLYLTKELRHVQFLSDLSPQTLASGFNVRQDRPDPSLLDKLKNHVLCIKELTTVLSKRAESRAEILGQLREVYDGVFDKAWGTGKQFTWEGRVSLIAGVTDEIDRQHSVMSALGPRFLFLRVRQPDRKSVARRALHNRNIGEAQKTAQKVVKDFFKTLSTEMPETPEQLYERLGAIADFVTRARSVVHKDDAGNPEYAPQPEAPGRLVRQLHALAAGLAIVHGRREITSDDVDRVERVAHDCLPPARRLIIEAIRELGEGACISDIERHTRLLANQTVRRELLSLRLLGTVFGSVEEGWRLSEVQS
jgi:hypothetical protein